MMYQSDTEVVADRMPELVMSTDAVVFRKTFALSMLLPACRSTQYTVEQLRAALLSAVVLLEKDRKVVDGCRCSLTHPVVELRLSDQKAFGPFPEPDGRVRYTVDMCRSWCTSSQNHFGSKLLLCVNQLPNIPTALVTPAFALKDREKKSKAKRSKATSTTPSRRKSSFDATEPSLPQQFAPNTAVVATSPYYDNSMTSSTNSMPLIMPPPNNNNTPPCPSSPLLVQPHFLTQHQPPPPPATTAVPPQSTSSSPPLMTLPPEVTAAVMAAAAAVAGFGLKGGSEAIARNEAVSLWLGQHQGRVMIITVIQNSLSQAMSDSLTAEFEFKLRGVMGKDILCKHYMLEEKGISVAFTVCSSVDRIGLIKELCHCWLQNIEGFKNSLNCNLEEAGLVRIIASCHAA